MYGTIASVSDAWLAFDACTDPTVNTPNSPTLPEATLALPDDTLALRDGSGAPSVLFPVACTPTEPDPPSTPPGPERSHSRSRSAR